MLHLTEALRRLLAFVFLSVLTFLYSPDLHAQQRVDVGANDIGGVVTRPERAGSRRLGDCRDHRSADPIHPHRRHRRPGPLRHPRSADRELQVWVRGYGLVDSPKLRAKPGQHLDLTAVPAPSDGGGRALLSGDLLVRDDEDSAGKDFGGSTDIPKNITRDNWLRQMNNVDCIGCHQLGQEATRTIPGAASANSNPARRHGAPHPVRTVRRDDDQPHRRPIRRRAVQVFRRLDRPRRQGRTAEGQAAAARTASSAISSSPPGTGRHPTSICTI